MGRHDYEHDLYMKKDCSLCIQVIAIVGENEGGG
jgi:hypothetical protein